MKARTQRQPIVLTATEGSATNHFNCPGCGTSDDDGSVHKHVVSIHSKSLLGALVGRGRVADLISHNQGHEIDTTPFIDIINALSCVVKTSRCIPCSRNIAPSILHRGLLFHRRYLPRRGCIRHPPTHVVGKEVSGRQSAQRASRC